MRLIEVQSDGTLTLVDVNRHNVPAYAILSHTWEASDQELTIQDMRNGTGTHKNGYRKLTFCARQTLLDGLHHLWIDSACIDRTNNVELTEAINSMFRWYRDAKVCYVYLVDVHGQSLDEGTFRASRHHKRGWTLQEIIAPSTVQFFSNDGHKIGDKVSLELQLHEITGIDVNALRDPDAVGKCSVETRMSWSLGRETTIEEDQVYCLLGIFGVYIPLIYGEGKSNAFRRLRSEINAASRDPQTIGNTAGDQAEACLSSLEAVDQSRDLKAILNRSKNGCNWILKNAVYLSWFEGKHSSTMWISAKAGHGKTTLAAHIYDSLQQASLSVGQSDTANVAKIVTLCFFFQRSNNEATSAASTALSTMIVQLAQQVPGAMALLLKQYALLSRKGKFEWSLSQLSDALDDMIATISSQFTVYIIVDAFDESTIDSRTPLIDWIKSNATFDPSQAQDPKVHAIVKALITSRSDGEMLDYASDFPRLELKLSDTADDIHALIESRTAELAKRRRLSPKVVESIVQFLETRAHGMFIWVILILKELEHRNERLTDDVIKAKLSAVPENLIDTYKIMLDSGSQARGSDMWRILRWLMFATRILTLNELQAGMCLETETDSWYDFRGDLDYICGSLLQISGEKELVTFVHPTARDYVLTVLRSSSSRVFDGISLNYPDFDNHLLGVCLQHWNQYGCLRKLVNQLWPRQPYAQRMRVVKHHLAHECSFCSYAASAWYQHLQALYEPSPEVAKMVLDLMEDRWSRDGLMILKFYSEGRSWGPGSKQTTLHIAAYFNLPWLARQYIQQHADAVHGTTYLYITPIIFAAEMGATEVMELLLEAGADPNAFEKDGWSALHWAARNGHSSIVQLLIDHGAQLLATDASGSTPLDWAVDREHWDSAALLLMAVAKESEYIRQDWGLSLAEEKREEELHGLREKLMASNSSVRLRQLHDSRLDLVDNLETMSGVETSQAPLRSKLTSDRRANQYAALADESPFS